MSLSGQAEVLSGREESLSGNFARYRQREAIGRSALRMDCRLNTKMYFNYFLFADLRLNDVGRTNAKKRDHFLVLSVLKNMEGSEYNILHSPAGTKQQLL
jgi:hypothetical protein